MKTIFLSPVAFLFVATLAPAANTPAMSTSLKSAIVFNAEKSYIDSRIGILENEILNNDEEEYILLAPNDGYFTGFTDGMTDAVAQLSGFNYTGDAMADFAAIASNLLIEENAADALGTLYGTGVGTAYQYALVVLNSNLEPTTVGRTEVPEAKAGSPASKAVSSIDRPAFAQVRLIGAQEQR